MYATITLIDELQQDLRNPVEVLIKDTSIDVVGGLVYVYLSGPICGKEEVTKFLYRQLAIQKRMAELTESSNAPIKICYSIEVFGSIEDDTIESADLILDPSIFDVETEEDPEGVENAI